LLVFLAFNKTKTKSTSGTSTSPVTQPK
jgi:hypothetical protein